MNLALDPAIVSKRIDTIARYKEDLMSGVVFARHAASGRSAYGYRPVLNRDAWSHAMVTLGQMAATSNAFAQIAAGIFGRVNLYGTRPEASAQVYQAAADVLAKGYDDVVGRSAPDAGRYSDHQRDFSLAERVLLQFWLAEATSKMQDSVPGVGWVTSLLADELELRIPAAALAHKNRRF